MLGEKYQVVPELITEGGIEFIDPSCPYGINDEQAYKSMRIRADRCFYLREYTNEDYYYPPIDSADRLAQFKDPDKVFIGPCREAENRKFISGFETVLKAFSKNSRPWSDKELSLIEAVFNEYGCQFKKKIRQKANSSRKNSE
ncbi:hypothetical protein DVH05_017124 [Phytophthora capsici]|nr:hypothetical protein DVH05_017124 [Phytophthora capsici]